MKSQEEIEKRIQYLSTTLDTSLGTANEIVVNGDIRMETEIDTLQWVLDS